MSNPNFVSDLVAMAKAFEELPQVRAELEAKTHGHDLAQQMIQRLELRLMDLKTELDAAHAATRKVEVERDHAERMFLETDDRLNAFRRLLGSFQTEADALIAAAEPGPKPEPVIELPAEVTHEAELHPQADEPQGERAADPTLTSTQTTELTPSSGDGTQSDKGSVFDVTEAVSVQPDPTPVTESSSENVSSGSNVSSTQHEEAPHPVDPTASSTAGDGHSPANVELTKVAEVPADASSQTAAKSGIDADDVGYHNEPQIKAGDGGWLEWDAWCNRMNLRYPRELGGWPPRNAPATA